jgi:hypothetical protein
MQCVNPLPVGTTQMMMMQSRFPYNKKSSIMKLQIRIIIIASILFSARYGQCRGIWSGSTEDPVQQQRDYPVKPQNWKQFYNAVPQASNTKLYAKSALHCKGPFALCAYATCVKVPNSDPPVAECGCFSYPENVLNRGAIVGTLDRTIKDAMKQVCKDRTNTTVCSIGSEQNPNQALFCKEMNDKTLYSKANPDFISTFNPNKWAESTGYVPAEVQCPNGGTYTNCNSAACYDARPSSPYLPDANKFNATCYCPYYVTMDPVSVWNASANPCGPTNPADVKKDTLIFNGL